MQFVLTLHSIAHIRNIINQSVNVGTTHKDEVLSIFFVLHWNVEIDC